MVFPAEGIVFRAKTLAKFSDAQAALPVAARPFRDGKPYHLLIGEE